MKTALAMAVAAALLMPRLARAEWTRSDTAWEAAYLTLHAMDWGTTLDGRWRNEHRVRNGRIYPQYVERNPILGKDPARGEINAYMLSTAVLHVGVSALLPEGRWRRAWQAGTVGLEFYVVRRNIVHCNLKVRF